MNKMMPKDKGVKILRDQSVLNTFVEVHRTLEWVKTYELGVFYELRVIIRYLVYDSEINRQILEDQRYVELITKFYMDERGQTTKPLALK